MKATILIIGLFLIGVAILGGVWYLNQEQVPEFTIEPPEKRTVFADHIFGFAASYPEELVASSLEDHSVIIEDGQGIEKAHLRILESGPGERFESFDAFISAVLPQQCASWGTPVSAPCTGIAEDEQYWADGASGKKITLIAQPSEASLPSDATLVGTTSEIVEEESELETEAEEVSEEESDATTTASANIDSTTSDSKKIDITEPTPQKNELPEAALRGPWYVFNITAASSSVYSALVVLGPLSIPEETIDHELIESIAQSMVITIITERRETLGFAKSMRQDIGGFEITFDGANWLTGPEAVAAASAAGACDSAKPEECLPNGYYIENASSTEESFRLTPEATVRTVTSPVGNGGTPDTFHKLTPAEFLTLVNDPESVFSKVPYRIKIISGKVAEITEVYIP